MGARLLSVPCCRSPAVVETCVVTRSPCLLYAPCADALHLALCLARTFIPPHCNLAHALALQRTVAPTCHTSCFHRAQLDVVIACDRWSATPNVRRPRRLLCHAILMCSFEGPFLVLRRSRLKRANSFLQALSPLEGCVVPLNAAYTCASTLRAPPGGERPACPGIRPSRHDVAGLGSEHARWAHGEKRRPRPRSLSRFPLTDVDDAIPTPCWTASRA